MSSSIPFDGQRITICPACGYPCLGAGLCAACVPTAAAAPVDSPMNIVAGESDFNPAA
jgi:hypothetical protein